MLPERWQQVKDALQEALQLPPAQRKLYLDKACDGDRLLRDEIESLLSETDPGTERFLQSTLATVADLGDDGACVGRQVGSYEIIEMIGEGGMGTVYRAARADQQYQKQVAIKIVKQGFDTPFAVARFRAERQILANLEHPNIARLLDGGTTENGLPYVVMELVEGQPIDEYCNARTLSVEDRLRLFRTVCLAVQYAHQHLVVHRDLKPGNILVTADGTPKLLDFGIAKILDTGSLPGGAEPTIGFMRMLTPEYASPEQVRGETVTTASDVYSLGVILFLLLTGRHPYPYDSRSADAIVRAVCETEPPKPSTAARQTEEAAARGRTKQTSRKEELSTGGKSSGRLSKRLRGDLDNIALMALRKDPQRRYASAEQLAGDIQRHLEKLPVVARKDTARYRAAKFMTRHKIGVAATTLVVILLVAALLIAVHEAKVAQEQRARAERRFNDVRQLANSLIFEIHDKIQDLPGSTEVRKLLVERALSYLDSLAQEPGSEPSLRRELAAAYVKVGDVQGTRFGGNLGDTQGALESYQKALTIREELLKANPSSVEEALGVAITQRYVAGAAGFRGAPDALEKAEGALASAERVLQAAPGNATAFAEVNIDHEVAASMTDARGDYQQALVHMRIVVPMAEKRLQASPDNRSVQNRLAIAEGRTGFQLTRLGLRQEAQEHFQHSLQISETLAADPNDVERKRVYAYMLRWFAEHLRMQGDVKGASQVYRKSIVILEPLFAADPKNSELDYDLASVRAGLGNTLAVLGQFEQGLVLLNRGAAMLEADAARDPVDIEPRESLAAARNWIGDAFAQRRDTAQALESYEKGLAIMENLAVDTKWPKFQSEVAMLHARIGVVLARAGKADNAAEEYRRGLEIAEPIVASQPHIRDAQFAAAEIYADLGELSQRLASETHRTQQQQLQDWKTARAWYQRSLDTWQGIQNPGAATPTGFACGNPQTIAAAVARCDAALARLLGS